jgi:ubiquinol-cytochrome c reductase cytochrome c subunit
MRWTILLTIALMASWAGAFSSAQAPAAEAPKGNVENGKKIYTGYGCYQCHNYAANGGGAGPRLAPRPIPWTAFSQYVRAPKDQMPPYTPKSVSDQELADIYAFLLSIPAPPAADSIPILKP